jgi:hypothetical protein
VDKERVTELKSARVEDVGRMLDEQSRELGFASIRVALGKSGIAVRFRRESMLHLSWWALAAFLGTVALVRRARR